ncbi:hypothetical protein NQZ68_005117 [Dissostichus eleginoides]|nr:hypothetical protein NQZ68_005117 [Dissostichus eleginoides]
MAEASFPDTLPDLEVIIDPDFEPQKRPRSCTWPLPRPDSNAVKPDNNDTDIIPEEEDDEDDNATTTANDGSGLATEDQGSSSPVADGGLSSSGQESGGSPHSSHSPTATSCALTPSGLAAQQTPRKASSRRNAWGNLSYADLITKAIESTPDKRLTLSQIYDWMVRSIPYFKDKGDSNSSAGWKPHQVKAGFTVTMQGSYIWNFGHEGQAVGTLNAIRRPLRWIWHIAKLNKLKQKGNKKGKGGGGGVKTVEGGERRGN